MRRLALFLLLSASLLLPSAAFAEEALSTPTAKARELAKTLSQKQNGAPGRSALNTYLGTDLLTLLERDLPGVGPETKSVMRATVADSLTRFQQRARDLTAQAYLSSLSERELADLVGASGRFAPSPLVKLPRKKLDELDMGYRSLASDALEEAMQTVCKKTRCHTRPLPNELANPRRLYGGDYWADASVDIVQPPNLDEGTVRLQFACRINKDGQFEPCRTDREGAGPGMTRAALEALSTARLKTRLLDGSSVEGLYALLTVYYDPAGANPARFSVHITGITATLGPPLRNPFETPAGRALPSLEDAFKRPPPSRSAARPPGS